MVDRIFALWQGLYPDSYVEPARQWTPTFWYENGTVLDADSGKLQDSVEIHFNQNTDLEPFYSDPSGNFWTANSARKVETFGYTYPELQTGDASSLKSAINTLYGPNTINFFAKARKFKRGTTADSDRVYRLIFQAPKGRLPSTYTIFFFLGNPASENPSNWLTDKNLMGSQAFLQAAAPGNGLHPVTVTGVVPLNAVLEQWMGGGRLPSLGLDDVLALLSGNMNFRVQLCDGTEASIELLPELKVGLASIQIIPPNSIDEFPTYVGDWDVHYSATQGQPGGMNGPEDV
jgi:tyrosinase